MTLSPQIVDFWFATFLLNYTQWNYAICVDSPASANIHTDICMHIKSLLPLSSTALNSTRSDVHYQKYFYKTNFGLQTYISDFSNCLINYATFQLHFHISTHTCLPLTAGYSLRQNLLQCCQRQHRVESRRLTVSTA